MKNNEIVSDFEVPNTYEPFEEIKNKYKYKHYNFINKIEKEDIK